jgi:hypothetical protein
VTERRKKVKMVFCMEKGRIIRMEDAPKTACYFSNCRYWDRCAGPAKVEIAREKKAQRVAVYEQSLEVARMIDVNELYDFCRELDKAIKSSVKEYTPGFQVEALPAEGESFIVYVCDGDQICRIGHTKHPMQYVDNAAKEFNGQKLALGFGKVTDDMVSQVLPTLMIRNRVPAQTAVAPRNPVYITDGQLRRVIREVYGMDGWVLRRVFAQNLGLTEFKSGDTTIYLKAEMDAAIRNTGRKSKRK